MLVEIPRASHAFSASGGTQSPPLAELKGNGHDIGEVDYGGLQRIKATSPAHGDSDGMLECQGKIHF